MQPEFFAKLEAKLSPARMRVYNADGKGACIALARYLLNATLSEALYSPLQLCEVALRNSIHSELIELTGKANWYDDPRFPMTTWGGTEIQKAKGKLVKHGK